jgi:8-oxo-dGTP diphosphatase
VTWTDSKGRSLADYPRPSIAVDVALLTVTGEVDEQKLSVLVHRPAAGHSAGRWCLPAALRALHDKVGVTGRRPQQLRVFDALGRDDRGRVMTVAHVDLVPLRQLHTDGDCHLADIEDGRLRLPGNHRHLAYDHDAIVEHAVQATREAYLEKPDPSGLLGSEFTLLQLHRIHAAVLGPLTPHKDSFRRRMSDHLMDTGRLSSGVVGKPARLFTRE